MAELFMMCVECGLRGTLAHSEQPFRDADRRCKQGFVPEQCPNLSGPISAVRRMLRELTRYPGSSKTMQFKLEGIKPLHRGKTQPNAKLMSLYDQDPKLMVGLQHTSDQRVPTSKAGFTTVRHGYWGYWSWPKS
jgi:nucleoid-associated protein YejK